MKLNIKEEKQIGVTSQSLMVGKRGIKSLNDNLNTLNTTNEYGEGEKEGGSDVTQGFTPSQKKIWNRLTKNKQDQIIEKAKKTGGNVSSDVTKLSNNSDNAKGLITSKKKVATKGVVINKGKTAGATATKTGIAATTKATGGVGLVIGGATKVGRGFASSLQRGIDVKANSATINLQQISAEKQASIILVIAVQIAIATVQMVAMIFTSLIAVLIPIIIALAVVTAIVSIIVAVAHIFTDSGSAGNTLVEVAKYQLESQSGIVGGQKYKEWYGIDGNWCAMFVSYCANEAGFIDDGTIPLTASVSVQQQWFIDKGLYKTKESGYKPKAGDIIIFKNGISHTGIVIDYDADTDRVTTIEGNTGGSVTSIYHQGSSVKECSYSRLASTISGYGTPDYPKVEEVEEVKEVEEGE